MSTPWFDWGRTARLARKELREILRDRRTIVTLVLMPLLVYPLLSVVLQRYMLTQANRVLRPALQIGFASEREWGVLQQFLLRGGLQFASVDPSQSNRESSAAIRPGEPSSFPGDHSAPPRFEPFLSTDFDADLRTRRIDVALRLKTPLQQIHLDPRRDLSVDVDLMFDPESPTSNEAADYVQAAIDTINLQFLSQRLKALRIEQRTDPVFLKRTSLESAPAVELQGHARSGSLSIQAIIPFILILMTITGAVYPAIDLTAGERERGTLEILVAAPIPRLGVLFGKYVAVVTVALATALANLTTMLVTLSATGLGRALFGSAGPIIPTLLAVLALLLLFACFFSAVLLALTSVARSFKEAQAYLIPLMLISLAPGMVGLVPGLKLSGVLLVTPLANIVLLGRDLLSGTWGLLPACIVVGSTTVYAAAAISLAARLFGAENVLYSQQVAWSDAWRRTETSRDYPPLSSALMCLALCFPAYFFANAAVGMAASQIEWQISLAAFGTVVVFAGFPILAMYWGRVRWSTGLRLHSPQFIALAVAVVLGCSLWTLAHELVLLQVNIGLVSLEPELLERSMAALERIRELPVVMVVLCLAVIPAVCEELFFRGYLFSALHERTPVVRIVASAIIFGLFHVVVTDRLAIERLATSTALGLVLGLICEKTGSLFPGMLLHAVHNGLLITVGYFKSNLAAAGFGIEEQQHLPALWLAAGTAAAVTAGIVLYRSSAPVAQQAQNETEGGNAPSV